MTLSELLGVVKNAIKQSLFKVEGKVEVDFPDVQRVELVNPSAPTETVEVSNLPALEESFSKAVFELGDNLITKLEELQKVIPEDKTSKITEKIEKLGKSLGKDLDLSKVIKGLSDIKNGIDGIEIPKNEVDLKPILTEIKRLGELIPDLSEYSKYGEFKVLLNPEQLKQLIKAFNVSLAVSGSGGGNQYTAGDSITGGTGPLIMGKSDSTGVATPIRVKETSGKVVVTLDGNSSVLAQGTFTTGSKSGIGTSQVQLVSSGSNSMALTIQADISNTGTVYVGKTGVTAGTNDATDGYPLLAGDSLDIYYNAPANVYLIASAAGQKVYWMSN